MLVNKKQPKQYPTTRQVLLLAGIGAFILGSLIMPGLPILLKGRRLERDIENFLTPDSWNKFDEARLRQKLKILRKQKVVKIYTIGDKFIVQITKKGQQRLLQYKLSELEIPKPKSWDGKWRIVAYDIPEGKKAAANALRDTLKGLGFFQLQRSVYLYPYPCTEAIEFLRELYGIGEYVTYLKVGYLEQAEAFKEYFKL